MEGQTVTERLTTEFSLSPARGGFRLIRDRSAKTKKMKSRSPKPVADNEAFIALIRVAQEDKEIRAQLQSILQQPLFHRKSLLNTMIQNMTLKGAPKEFISAIGCLLDDTVAEKTQELITGNHYCPVKKAYK